MYLGTYLITINERVIYSAQNIMILIQANPFGGILEGPKKVEMFRALTMGQVMDLPASKSLRTGPYK